jgi:hypothetical protein
MIKAILILAILVCTLSCSKKPKATEFTDDYVLIEFAAKLEEDYYRLYPEPLENRTKESAD